MKKLFATLLAALLVISLVPFSAVAASYVIPDYAVSLNATETEIYEGETVDISYVINSEEFILVDMSLGYDTEYFECAGDTTGVVTFDMPEEINPALVDGDDEYELQTTFQFEAKEVDDTVEVEFTVKAADITYSYDSAMANEDTNVSNRTGVKVKIIKQYDVVFQQENGNALSEQTVDKGLGSEEDTAITAPVVDYAALGYVASGLEADYYEHVWVYDGVEYTDEEIAEFGKAGSPEITEDTVFVLEVREQTFSVTASDEEFDNPADTATYGTDYTGTIHPDEYDEKYIYTVKYTIGGNEEEVECVGDSFTIPGNKITGDMTITFEKELGIEIELYEYITGYYLVTVRGGAAGYTFNGYEMFKSETHNNLRAWIFEPDDSNRTYDDAMEYAESVIFVSDVASEIAPAGYDLNYSNNIDLNDPTLALGAYRVELKPVENWVKTYLTADVDGSYEVNTLDYNLVVAEYKRNK